MMSDLEKRIVEADGASPHSWQHALRRGGGPQSCPHPRGRYQCLHFARQITAAPSEERGQSGPAEASRPRDTVNELYEFRAARNVVQEFGCRCRNRIGPRFECVQLGPVLVWCAQVALRQL